MADAREGGSEAPDTRARILQAASRLITTGGVAALTTRAVAAAASVQAPTLYRLFGDKRGLLNAVAEHGLTAFFAQKTAVPPHPDPVQTLRDAWDSYVAFGLSHPAVFAITNEVGSPASGSPAMLAGLAILRERVQRIARAGRLRMPVERAVALIHAAGVGTVATLLALPEGKRDPQLSPAARDAVLASISVDASVIGENDVATLAVALRALLGNTKALTPGERLLLDELLDRLSDPTSSD
ncbi:MAG: TetR/AcrR family transcriptional regulator [Janthinobacterium lividum]